MKLKKHNEQRRIRFFSNLEKQKQMEVLFLFYFIFLKFFSK